MNVTLILGGTRSGKSRYAQELALRLSAEPWYVATSRVWDDDHRARIERHRRERGPMWRTLECEVELGGLELEGRVAVIDCLTLWLTNIFSDAGGDPEGTLARARAELDRLFAGAGTCLLVSNEVGQGLHAPTEVGRKFADLQGLVNQYAAARAGAVALLVAGIPLYVKGAEPRDP